MRAIKQQRHPAHKKKRSPAFLLAQVGGGGVVGVLIALVILKYFGADYFGFGRASEGPVGISEDRQKADDKQPKIAKVPPVVKPSNKPRANNPVNSGNKLIASVPDKSPSPTGLPPITDPANSPPTVEKPTRTPLAKEAIAEFFAKAQLSPASKYWWCEQGVFELDDRAGFRFTPNNGATTIHWPAAFTDQFLELDNEAHDQRIRLFADHAESAAEPFDAYKPLYANGKWLVPAEQSGVDWFARALVDLDSTSRQARAAAKEYMANLFTAAEKLKAAGKLKDVPFGFDLAAERDRFTKTGLVPWTAPLLPMTSEYVQECRKMLRNEEGLYNRIALRLNGQRDKPAKDFLEYHQWRFARAWPLAVLSWKDATGNDVHYTLLSNGSVNIDASKDTWKITGDILDVDIGEKRVRLKINQQGKEFSIIGADPPVTGKFLYEPPRVAY